MLLSNKTAKLKVENLTQKALSPFPLETALPEYCYDLDGSIKLSEKRSSLLHECVNKFCWNGQLQKSPLWSNDLL